MEDSTWQKEMYCVISLHSPSAIIPPCPITGTGKKWGPLIPTRPVTNIRKKWGPLPSPMIPACPIAGTCSYKNIKVKYVPSITHTK